MDGEKLLGLIEGGEMCVLRGGQGRDCDVGSVEVQNN